MRKVYQQEKSGPGMAVALLASIGFTALLFCILPFAHRINKSEGVLELVKAAAVDVPPPVDDIAPPEIEEEKKPEAAPEPELADVQQQAIPITADLEVATGSGGGFLGANEIRSLTAAEVVQDDAFNVADLEKRPEAVSQVTPTYPAELKKAKVEGVVTLLFVLDETGRVEDPRVESSTRPEFEKPALEAIRKWRYSPGMKDGQAVRTYIKVPIRFRMPAG